MLSKYSCLLASEAWLIIAITTTWIGNSNILSLQTITYITATPGLQKYTSANNVEVYRIKFKNLTSKNKILLVFLGVTTIKNGIKKMGYATPRLFIWKCTQLELYMVVLQKVHGKFNWKISILVPKCLKSLNDFS